MNPKKANGNDLDRTDNKISAPDIIMSAADFNRDVARGLAVGMVEGTDKLPMAAAASGRTSSQTQTPTDQDAVMMEKERIFMGEINRMIDKYNAENKQQAASMSCLPQKRPASSLTVTHTRCNESTGMFVYYEKIRRQLF